jgi:hypothetical protein
MHSDVILKRVCPWLVIALYACILTALYAETKFRPTFALFLAFYLIHAKNCIIGLPYV